MSKLWLLFITVLAAPSSAFAQATTSGDAKLKIGLPNLLKSPISVSEAVQSLPTILAGNG